MSSKLTTDPGGLAALAIGQLCHDLAGPVGAVLNGAEMLQDTRINSDEVVSILTQSAEAVGTILQFYRFAWGAATVLQGLQENEIIKRIATDFLSRKNIALHLTSQTRLASNEWVRLLLGTLYLAAKALPRGGHISVNMVKLDGNAGNGEAALGIVLEGERCGSLRELLAPLDAEIEKQEAVTRSNALVELIQLQYRHSGVEIVEKWFERRLYLELRMS